MGSLLHPVQVHLDGFPSFQCIDSTAQLGVICKFAEGALNPTIRRVPSTVTALKGHVGSAREGWHFGRDPHGTRAESGCGKTKFIY